MPMKKVRARLRWKGSESVPEILSRLDERERVLLILPSGFHHAVSSSVGSEDALHGPLDVALNDAAFERLVRIRGLSALAGLREPLARSGTSVRVRTPPPQILFVPRDRAVRHRTHHHSRPAAVVI